MSSNKYDVIVIGGGIAGLIAGLHLQKLGKRSLILEHGHQVGGNMSGIWRQGFYFDCGDQSTENVGIIFPILKELGLYDPGEWIRARFRWATPDLDCPFLEYGQMRDDFKKAFPGSTRGVDQWFDYIVPICNSMRKMFGGGPQPFVVDGWEKVRANLRMMSRAGFMVRKGREMMKTTGEEKALEMFADEPRLLYLCGESSLKNVPLMMHYIFWYTFTEDYWYPRAGLQGLMNKLADAYRERGGEIRFKSTVDKVITSGKVATEVETSGKERFQADYFINAGNLKRLINTMLDRPEEWDHRERQIFTAGQLTPAVSSAFLGLDMDAGELRKYMKTNHTIYWRTYETAARDIYDPEAHNKGWSFISAPSLDLPHLAPPGKSSLVVQVFTSYHWRNGWGTGSADPMARSPEYRELKQKVLEDIIRKTEYIIPGLAKRVVYKELATPRSMSRWTLNEEGAIMGWTYDSFQSPLKDKYVNFRTPIKNLFNAGHYSVWPGGVVFSAMSGRVVAKGICQGFLRQLIY
ncbi:MAG: NAD(P)/FAD-dependent oxidoreductase [Proteobacteria bacterium]|nr:NAD(P)/FAD-dependent oxidoreductase [Pseudomonadota bacterium]